MLVAMSVSQSVCLSVCYRLFSAVSVDTRI